MLTRVGGLHTTSDFTNLLTGAGNRILLRAYHRGIAAEGSGVYPFLASVHQYLAWKKQDLERRARLHRPSDEVLAQRARKLKLENDRRESELFNAADVVATINAIVGMLRAEFEGFPDRFPEHRPALAREIGSVLDAMEARRRNAIADLMAGHDPLRGKLNEFEV